MNIPMRRRLFYCLIATGAMLPLHIDAMAQPIITLESLGSDGVYLLPPTTSAAVRTLDPQRDDRLDVLLPYSPLIKNETTKQIIAYSVRWFCTNSNGKVLTPEVAIYDFSAFPSTTNLPAGAQRLVSHIPGLGSRGPVYAQVGDQVSDLLALFGTQETIVISLDAVVFDDGTTIGPDSKQWIARWKAHIDAERDVYTAVAHSNPAAVHGVLESFSMPAIERGKPFFKDAHLGIPHLQTAAQHATSYQEAYEYMRGVFALVLNEMIAQQGEAATIATVGGIINSKRYPAIRREGFGK